MPRIATYTAPDANLRADRQGYGAYENAGRRISGLANLGASATLRTGSAVARGLETAGELEARGILTAAQIENLRARIALVRSGITPRTATGGGYGFSLGSGGGRKSGDSANNLARAAADLTGLARDYGGGGELSDPNSHVRYPPGGFQTDSASIPASSEGKLGDYSPYNTSDVSADGKTFGPRYGQYEPNPLAGTAPVVNIDQPAWYERYLTDFGNAISSTYDSLTYSPAASADIPAASADTPAY